MKKIWLYFFLLSLCLLLICGCEKESYLEPPNMDRTMDFVLIDDTLVYCAEDGIYQTVLDNPENAEKLLPYPESYTDNLPRAGKANVFVDQSTENPVLNVFLFKHYGPYALNLRHALDSANPAENINDITIGNARALYKEYEDGYAYLSWPNQFIGPNAVTVFMQDGTQILFHDSPYMFGYRGVYPDTLEEHNRLERYKDKLYCLVSRYHETEGNYPNLYELDCKSGSYRPLFDYVVEDFVIDKQLLYFLSDDMLYQHNLDTDVTKPLTEAKVLQCTGQVHEFLTQTSFKTSNCSLAALNNNIFYVSPGQRLYQLGKDTPVYNVPIYFLQQQENYLIAILQTGDKIYQTVVLDGFGKELLNIPGINRLSIENNIVIYSDGNHLYQAAISS